MSKQPLDPYTREPLVVRSANVSELEEVIELAAQSVVHSLSQAGSLPADHEQLVQARRRDLKSIYRFWGDPELSVFVVRDSRERLLGHIIIGGNETHTFRLARQARIYDISLSPEMFGSGIADLLMSAGENFARERGYAFMTLTVTKDNTRAVRFYEKSSYFQERIQMLKDLRPETTEASESC